MQYTRKKKTVFGIFGILFLLSCFSAFFIKFTFDFEQFFPEGDDDLTFFREFVEEFETDDNFLLIAIENEGSVFDSAFLDKFHAFSLACRNLPYVNKSQSLTQLKYPLKTPFGFTQIPVIHRRDVDKLSRDSIKIFQDNRFVYNLIDEQSRSMAVVLKTIDNIDLPNSQELIDSLKLLIDEFDFKGNHLLGRAFFMTEMVWMQKRELAISTFFAILLVTLVLFLIFRNIITIGIALVSIGLGLVLFIGTMVLLEREFNAMAAFYPVLMLIVGTSDVIHIMSKYMDELKKGHPKYNAINTTIREIGLATFLTSITTSVGFLTLLTSKIGPIKDFGINSAIGVVIAYITVIFFTTTALTMFPKEQILKTRSNAKFWDKYLLKINTFTILRRNTVIVGALILVGACMWSISTITTNYDIKSNLPLNEKLTEDFLFYEENYAGFRPMEFAVMVKEGTADSYEILQEIDKLENHLRQQTHIKSVQSITDVYKSINQAISNNKQSAYQIPTNEKQFKKIEKLLSKYKSEEFGVLMSTDKTKARISAKIKDIGADSVTYLSKQIDGWIAANLDVKKVEIKRTGTGVIIDKNSIYVRDNLLYGLGFALLTVSLLMVFLFRNVKMLIISLVPNILPLIIAAGILGIWGKELEAGISIVFAIIFGIAVDDTIHFLSKFKLALDKGYDREEAIRISFVETGKAITLTSIILFFGFMVLFFSIHPPSIVIGVLISITLLSALFSDLLLIPVMIRMFGVGKDREDAPE